VAALFAFVPVIDAVVLWLPAAVYLGLEGRWGEALGVAALGSLLVRALENFLYPVLVKDRLRVPSVSIFVALLGGLLVFGWSGLVLGPAILTFTNVLLEISAKRMAEPPPAVPRPDCSKLAPAECGDSGGQGSSVPINSSP
jgi:predicted PurR-regulated permease PerM